MDHSPEMTSSVLTPLPCPWGWCLPKILGDYTLSDIAPSRSLRATSQARLPLKTLTSHVRECITPRHFGSHHPKGQAPPLHPRDIIYNILANTKSNIIGLLNILGEKE
jgi:hypothetical protein